MTRMTPRLALLMLAALSLPGCGRLSAKQSLVAQATQRLERLEAKQGSLERLLEAAEATRDDLVQQLRGIGVASAADLKGSAKARALAATLDKTIREIDGYERDAALFTDALVQTQALLRRLERARTLEEAGLSEQEMATLAETNLALEEAAGGGLSTPIDPLQQEALLQRELARAPAKTARPRSLDKVIVGKWRPANDWDDVVEFTPQGKVLVEDKTIATYKVMGRNVTLLPITRDTFYDWKTLVMEAEILSPETLVFSLAASPGGELHDELESLLGKVERMQQ